MPYISEIPQIYIQRFYSGWITLRNQLAVPVRVMGRRVIELYDALIGGNDWEVTPKLSLKRRAGHTSYVTINFPAMNMYSWKTNTQGTVPIIDTTGDVEYISGQTKTVIQAKGVGTGQSLQSSLLGIGDFLYVGNPQTNFKFDGPQGTQGVTNWGIASVPFPSGGTGGTGGGSSAASAGNGRNVVSMGTQTWANPNNVNSAVSFATVTTQAPWTLNHFPFTDTAAINSEILEAYNFGFSGLTGTVAGVKVTFTAKVTGTGTGWFRVGLMFNGAIIGSVKTVTVTGSAVTFTLGSSSDLWSSSINVSQINNSTSNGFGIGFYCGSFGSGVAPASNSWSVDNVAATISIGGTTGTSLGVAVSAGGGSFSAVNGFTYVVSYSNPTSGEESNASLPSNNTGAFSSKAYVGIPVAASTDPQVSLIRVRRTTDSGGGNQFFEISNSPFPNVGYVLTAAANASAGSTVYTGSVTGAFASAVGQNFIVTGFTNGANNGTFPCTAASATTITLTNGAGVAETHAAFAYLLAEDTTPDTSLQVTSQAEINLGNTPPPSGLINLEWFSGRMWGSVNNLLFASTGPETLAGTAPNSNWNPSFQWVIPGVIMRNVRGPNGMMIFTQDDCYIVRGTDIVNYTVNEFVKDFGVRSYNAIDTDGTNTYVFTSDRQFILVSASGAQDIGQPIADQLLSVDPSQCYVKVNRFGLDSIVRILDTVNNVYYDFNLTQQCWNLPGILKMPSCSAAGSIETAIAVWRLLLSSTDGNGTSTLAYRDINNFQDLGVSYQPNAVFGSIQVADPGTLAKFGGRGGITLEFKKYGTQLPAVSVLPNDTGVTTENAVGSQITGNFVALNNPVPDPPTYGTVPVNYTAKRWYWSSAGKAISAFVRHFQFQISAIAENQPTELIGFGIFGDEKQEAASPGRLPELQGK